jgi:1-acyl-sn-glycerol-3-phosphate acyltransferase
VFAFLPGPLKGALASLLFGLNTLFWCLLIYIFAILKLLVPVRMIRRLCTKVMIAFGENWISFNNFEARLLHTIDWQISGLENLNKNRSYLVFANHQSWVDIVVLQKVFNRRIPFLRFFLKRQLLYVPFLGLAWWALDFPFMKRHTKAFLEKYPEKRGEDLETTRRACEKFQGSSISVLNFLEGTRFTPEKHARQNSTYKNLLAPKTGGIAFVLEAMGEQFDAVLDVTIFYPEGAKSLWGLFSGQLNEIQVHVNQFPIPTEFVGEKAKGRYLDDTVFREQLQGWIRDIWTQKDDRLLKLK